MKGSNVKKIIEPVGKFFMTVKRGQFSSLKAILEAIGENRKEVSKSAKKILEKHSISNMELEIDLWEVSISEMGLAADVPLVKVHERAFELGFTACLAEDMALALLKWDDGKIRLAGMVPVIDSKGVSLVLALEGLSLETSYGEPRDLWDPVYIWVLVRSPSK